MAFQGERSTGSIGRVINRNVFGKFYTNELLRNRMLNELFHEVVPVILKHDDLNSMYFSIDLMSLIPPPT